MRATIRAAVMKHAGRGRGRGRLTYVVSLTAVASLTSGASLTSDL